MAGFSRGVLAALLVLWMSAAGVAAERAIIVLDASGSMWGQIDGTPKLEIAREALTTVLQTIPGDMELGLMAYGHREKGSCEDIELIVEPRAGSGGAISAVAGAMKFLGTTPLSAAARQAAEALKYTGDKATVVLITDGLETCQADPCAVGAELEQAGIDFTAHVVGFGLTAEEGRQVACLAENTGGKYLEASDAAGLNDALAAAVKVEPGPRARPRAGPAAEPAAPEFNFIPKVAMAESGEPLIDAGNVWEIHAARPDGTKGERITTEYSNYKGDLEPGDYIVRAVLGEASVEQKLKIEAGEVYEPVFVLNAATLIVTPLASEGAEANDGATIVTDYPGGSATNYGRARIVLPAGGTKLTVRIGDGEVSETLTLVAGQTTEKAVIVGKGVGATVKAGERTEVAVP